MNQYEFTLKFQYPHEEEVQLATVENCLYENGCDDALVGLGRHGRIALQFNRGGKSAEEVIQRAIEDVLRALPDAQLIEAGPDCVGFTEIADIWAAPDKTFANSLKRMRKLFRCRFTTAVLLYGI